ncbi:MAG: response regulator transcription factor [Gaiellaceae bacterium]
MLITTFGQEDLLEELVARALPSMLQEGRLTSLNRWLDYARDNRIDRPLFDFARAEVALRQGLTSKAELLALLSAEGLSSRPELASRSYFIVGSVAHREQRQAQALTYFTKAREHAQTDSAIKEAVWGQLLCSASLEDPAAVEYLAELREWREGPATSQLQYASARHVYGLRLGDYRGIAKTLESVAPLLDKIDDPFVRTSFLGNYSHALSLAARYRDAADVSTRQMEEIERYHLTFALTPGLIMQAYSSLGLRRFAVAEGLLRRIEASPMATNPHLLATSRCLHARLLLAKGSSDVALALMDEPLDGPLEVSMKGEYLATRALSFAAHGDFGDAERSSQEAESLTKGIETRVLCACVKAIVELRRHDPSARISAHQAFAAAEAVGNLDSFVCSYRAYPPLLFALADEGDYAAPLTSLMRRAAEDGLASQAGLNATPRICETSLSPREIEVFELLAQGKTNREIARLLYISESTAKVHVRHILEKLGLRSRTEAAIHATTFGIPSRGQAKLPPSLSQDTGPLADLD